MTGADRGGSPADARLSVLFAEHCQDLTRFVVRRVGIDAAADVVSETFLIAWRRVDSIPDGFERAWLFRTAQYVIRHHQRGSARRQKLVARIGIECPDAVNGVGADHAETVADALFIQQVLQALPRRDREVLKLIEWDRLSMVEAASVTGCTVASLKVRLFRARRRFTAAVLAVEESSQTEERRPSVGMLIEQATL